MARAASSNFSQSITSSSVILVMLEIDWRPAEWRPPTTEMTGIAKRDLLVNIYQKQRRR
jgi:hypothetical protein